ncbi:hypothetical protein COO60DRAFT_171673 [Scenedesmus sp. NREL 46B-D3]|nr:hypothetical protein COO60DRAFT_171673 [Scenedesmus sp. NREL 46B-D3]
MPAGGSPALLRLVVSSCTEGVQMVADRDEQATLGKESHDGAAANSCEVSLWDMSERSSMRGKLLSLAAATAGDVQLAVGQLTPAAELPGQAVAAAGVMEAEFSSSYQANSLWEAAAGLSCLAQGGSMVLRLIDSMTSFSAGLLHLLSSCFGSLTLLKPFTSCSASSERFEVCQGLLPGGGCKEAAAQLMQAVRLLQKHLQQRTGGTGAAADIISPASPAAEASAALAAADGQASSMPVLELVPPPAVVSAPIFKYVAAHNMQLARQEVAAMEAATEQLKKVAAKAQRTPAERRMSMDIVQLAGLAHDMHVSGMAAMMSEQLDDSSLEVYKKLQADAEGRLAAWEEQAAASSQQQPAYQQAISIPCPSPHLQHKPCWSGCQRQTRAGDSNWGCCYMG